VVRGATVAEGHYELYSDNILDLSHANFVHPALVARAFTEGERRFWQDGETVHAEYVCLDDTLSEGIGAMLGRVGRRRISMAK
jgi:vanillate O-demethylase monooxygenase subunit